MQIDRAPLYPGTDAAGLYGRPARAWAVLRSGAEGKAGRHDAGASEPAGCHTVAAAAPATSGVGATAKRGG